MKRGQKRAELFFLQVKNVVEMHKTLPGLYMINCFALKNFPVIPVKTNF